MSSHHTLVERYLAAWTAGDLDAFDALVTPDYLNHSPGSPDPEPGPDGLKPIVAAMRRAIPDLSYELVHVVSEGDLVAFHTLVTGTQSGRSFRARQMQVERVRDGRIAEHWRVTDDTVPGSAWTSAPTPSASARRSPTPRGSHR
jgi:ketosteroid isomerase-like protein